MDLNKDSRDVLGSLKAPIITIFTTVLKLALTLNVELWAVVDNIIGRLVVLDALSVPDTI